MQREIYLTHLSHTLFTSDSSLNWERKTVGWWQGPLSLSQLRPLTLVSFRVFEAPPKAFLKGRGCDSLFSYLQVGPESFLLHFHKGMFRVTGTGRVLKASGVRGIWGGRIRINHMVKIREVEDHSRWIGTAWTTTKAISLLHHLLAESATQAMSLLSTVTRGCWNLFHRVDVSSYVTLHGGTPCTGLDAEGASKCSWGHEVIIKLFSFLDLGQHESSGLLKWHRVHNERERMGKSSRRRYMGGIWGKPHLY